MKLSPHFQLEEFTRSETAKRLKIDNTPTNEEVARLQLLCINLLEPLRNALQQPIIITSGYRCKRLNDAVGGVKDSYHIKGMAADIAIAGEKTANFAASFLLKLPETDQVIFECAGKARWLHVGWSYSPRHEYLKIIK